MTSSLSGLLLGAWLLLEVLLRRGAEARSWDARSDDRWSTRLVMLTYVLAFSVPLALGTPGEGVTPTNGAVAWLGIALGSVGLVVRVWSMRILGASYTRSLRTRSDQAIVDRGPYRVIRHPGYLGSILVWAGSRLAVNWIVAAATALLLGAVYVYRIDAEERMLDRHFGAAYGAYKQKTWRLLPLVW